MGRLSMRHNQTPCGLGGYRVPLRLPIDPNEALCSNRVVMADMPLPAWGEIKLAYNKAARPLEVGKDTEDKWS
jgi:hypothetical protein